MVLAAGLLPEPVPTKAVRRLAASVLVAEVFVVYFALLVVVRLDPERAGVAIAAAVALAGVAVLLCAALRRRWAYVVGWALQGALIAMGFVIPVMFALGLIFALLWGAVIRVGSRLVDR